MSCILDIGGYFFSRGSRRSAVYCESLAVGHTQPDMIGLPGMSGLCILGRRYKVGVLVLVSG